MASLVQRVYTPPRAGIARASALSTTRIDSDHAWSLDAVAGRFVELTGGPQSAALTTATGLIVEAQQRAQLAAWIVGTRSCVYPPDWAASGVDLRALPVVRARDMYAAARAADRLMRSRAFSIVVIDIGTLANVSFSMQTRLGGLAKGTGTTLISITSHKRQRNGGSLVSLRGDTEKRRIGDDCFSCAITSVKDKRTNPGWTHEEVCSGTDGLC